MVSDRMKEKINEYLKKKIDNRLEKSITVFIYLWNDCFDYDNIDEDDSVY
jgi:hypothetical protein